MRIPKMQASPQYRVTVPALDGGVNLKEAPNLVGDNQLTDARNVWWKDRGIRRYRGVPHMAMPMCTRMEKWLPSCWMKREPPPKPRRHRR